MIRARTPTWSLIYNGSQHFVSPLLTKKAVAFLGVSFGVVFMTNVNGEAIA